MSILTDSPNPTLKFQGLRSSDVETQRQKYGRNLLTPPEREPWWKLFLEKFDDPVIRILIIAAVVSIGVGIFQGHYAEGLGIILAVLLATTLAFLNEYKANREFDVLNKVNDDIPVKVIRDGHYVTVPCQDLVVDDIVLLELGEETPADGRVLEGVSLQVDESRLTGESVPVNKSPHDVALAPSGAEHAYPPDQILRGTMVVDGHGLIQITAVGDRTQIGQTARAAAEETDEVTPLNKQLERLSKLIGVIGLGVAALTFVALLVRGVLVKEFELTGSQWLFVSLLIVGVLIGLVRVWLPIVYDAFDELGWEPKRPPLLESAGLASWLIPLGVGAVVFGIGLGASLVMGWLLPQPSDWLTVAAGRELLNYFMIAVTIIVVAVPEGLAMSVTLSLAYSMRKMTAENNLVRRMHACETIGAATVICSDKTGTLTLNEMRVFGASFPLMPQGLSGIAPLVAEAIAVNSTANLSRVPGQPSLPLGNPTEGALLLWLDQHGVDYIPIRSGFALDCQLTFSTERKYMATLGVSPLDGRRLLHVKGAPETVLAQCQAVQRASGIERLDEAGRNAIGADLKDFQRRGMRTLALAYRELAEAKAAPDVEHLVADLVWLGFLAIADPIRPEVPAAIQACRQAGVLVKMVTGDNPETALEIARQIGLLDPGDPHARHISGREFAGMGEDDARRAAQDRQVFSRARPMDKMRLVRLLQEQGHIVAVTGDGTNDAPALNHANVGLAMGKTGTAVAKEASDIILLDDSFRSILNALMWGRSLYENIQRFILFQLTINVAALVIAFLGPFIGVKLPLTVIQMLWVNLIMDTFAALALATEPAHPSVLNRPPRNSDAFIITPLMAKSILGYAGIFLVALIGMLAYWRIQGVDLESATPSKELTIFFTVFVLLQFWNLFNARCMGRPESAFARLFQNGSFLSIALAILAGQILLVQWGGSIFRTVPLSLAEWGWILLATFPVLLIGETVRWFERSQAKSSLK